MPAGQGIIQAALLRGVNVGKGNRVPMAELRAIAESLGFRDARTLLNSGNLVFACTRAAARTSGQALESALAERLGVTTKVVTLGVDELDEIIEGNTLLKVATDDSHLLVAIPARSADIEKLRPLAEKNWGREALAIGSRAAYLWCVDGVIESAVSPAVNRALGDGVTSRNWATLLKLRKLMDGGA